MTTPDAERERGADDERGTVRDYADGEIQTYSGRVNRWLIEVTLPLAMAVIAYAIGWARLAARSPARRRPALVARLASSLAGLVVLAVALLGLHDAAHERFLPHMTQHLLLMMVAIPLL